MTALAVDWQRVRAVVFDVDGTLYDHRAMRLRMVRELALRCLVRPATLAEARVLRTFRQLREELADQEAAGIGRLQYERTAERLRLSVARVEAVVEEWILDAPTAPRGGLPHRGCPAHVLRPARRRPPHRHLVGLSGRGQAGGAWV